MIELLQKRKKAAVAASKEANIAIQAEIGNQWAGKRPHFGNNLVELAAINSTARRGALERQVHMEIIDTIKDQIENNPILLYMKGSPNQPQCGFSARTVQALMACGERFAYVDILSNPDIRTHLPKYANWPTFPQLWVDGELIGGCDIIEEMHQTGELQPLVKEAAAKSADTQEAS